MVLRSLLTSRRSLRLLICAFAIPAFALITGPSTIGAQSGQDPPPRDDVGTVRDFSDEVPAHIAVVDGKASLEREGRVEDAAENVPLLAGDRLRTERGRVQILYGDASVLDIDEDTVVDLLSESLIRLRAGRIRMTIPRSTGEDLNYRIDTAGGSALLRTAGEFRVSLDSRLPVQIDLAVFRGSAELVNNEGRAVVRAGMHATASDGTPPTVPNAFNSAMSDTFDRWCGDYQDSRYGHTSGQYLPDDLRPYGGVLDEYGSWQYAPSYGYVWYPRVDYGWRPYSVGRWGAYPSYGWTWIGHDRWSWPTHHYGRWQVSGASWFWIPDRHWSPAWVSWGYAPGYVGWCPLGYDGRAVYGFSNRYVDPWSAWTIMPSQIFVPNVAVASAAVSPRIIPPSIAGGFAIRPNAPNVPAIAVARARPLRAPTVRGIAVPRLTTPAIVVNDAGFSGAMTDPRQPGRRDDGGPSRTAPGNGRPNTGTADPGSRSDDRTPADRRTGVPRVAPPDAPPTTSGPNPRYQPPAGSTRNPEPTRPPVAGPRPGDQNNNGQDRSSPPVYGGAQQRPGPSDTSKTPPAAGRSGGDPAQQPPDAQAPTKPAPTPAQKRGGGGGNFGGDSSRNYSTNIGSNYPSAPQSRLASPAPATRNPREYSTSPTIRSAPAYEQPMNSRSLPERRIQPTPQRSYEPPPNMNSSRPSGGGWAGRAPQGSPSAAPSRSPAQMRSAPSQSSGSAGSSRGGGSGNNGSGSGSGAAVRRGGGR